MPYSKLQNDKNGRFCSIRLLLQWVRLLEVHLFAQHQGLLPAYLVSDSLFLQQIPRTNDSHGLEQVSAKEQRIYTEER